MTTLLHPCLQTCSIYDATESYGQILMEGPDTETFLHRLTSNDVKSLEIKKGLYNSLLTHKGKVQSLFYLYRVSSELFIIFVPKIILEKTLTLFTKMKFREKITIKNVSLERELIFLMGARAPEESAKLSISDQVFMAAESIAETPQIYVSYPKELKTSLMPHVAHLPWLAEEAYEGIRVRGRFPKYGIDIDENQILLESPIPMAYKRQKGCYPGQEVIERISAYGKGRTPTALCLFSCEGQAELPNAAPILSGDQTAGQITSSVFDPLTEKTWALGYLEQKYISQENSFASSGQTLIQHK